MLRYLHICIKPLPWGSIWPIHSQREGSGPVDTRLADSITASTKSAPIIQSSKVSTGWLHPKRSSRKLKLALQGNLYVISGDAGRCGPCGGRDLYQNLPALEEFLCRKSGRCGIAAL